MRAMEAFHIALVGVHARVSVGGKAVPGTFEPASASKTCLMALTQIMIAFLDPFLTAAGDVWKSLGRSLAISGCITGDRASYSELS